MKLCNKYAIGAMGWSLVLAICGGLAVGDAGQAGAAAQAGKEPVKAAGEVSKEDLKAVVDGNNEFAFDLYKKLAEKEKGNIIFSPYSISTALAMTYAGARGNTAKEMAKTLHFTLDNERLHPAFGELIYTLQGADKKRNYQLTVANSLWGAKGLSLDPKFQNITQTDYQAGFQFADFVKDAEGSRRTINAWVEDKTNKKIEELLPSDFIDANTRLILVNAVYFKGDWLVPFPKATTKLEDFTIPGKPAFKVPMMNRPFEANYLETANFQMVEFIYKGNEVSMVVILPKKQDGLSEVEKELSAKGLAKVLSAARPAFLQVALPKVKTTEAFDLEGQLAALGMKDAFGPTADFSGISPSESLGISNVVHNSFLNIDEMGTEAAGATAVKMSVSGLPPLIPFRADHPFLFVLRHNSTDSILFMGRVLDPRDK